MSKQHAPCFIIHLNFKRSKHTIKQYYTHLWGSFFTSFQPAFLQKWPCLAACHPMAWLARASTSSDVSLANGSQTMAMHSSMSHSTFRHLRSSSNLKPVSPSWTLVLYTCLLNLLNNTHILDEMRGSTHSEPNPSTCICTSGTLDWLAWTAPCTVNARPNTDE